MKAQLQSDGSLALSGAEEIRVVTPKHPRYADLMKMFHQNVSLSTATHEPGKTGYTIGKDGKTYYFRDGHPIPNPYAEAPVAAPVASHPADFDEDDDKPDTDLESDADDTALEAEPSYEPGYGGHPWMGGTPIPGHVYNVPLEHLHTDPERFQYKQNVNKSGVTDQFAHVKYDPRFAGVIAVWQDPKDRKTYVINGHHRYELAERSGDVDTMAVRYINAKTAKEARAAGAIINMAGGKGTAMDAAKFLRDSGMTLDDLKRENVSLKSKVAADGAVLATLNDRLFTQVQRGQMSEETAVAIARHLPNPNMQDQLANFLAKKEESGKEYAPKVIEDMAREMAATPTHTTTESTLFGDIESEDSLFGERNELKTAVRTDLAKAVNDFKAVASERRAGVVGAAGNVLDVEGNKKTAEANAQTLAIFDKLVNSRGPISDALNEGAKLYAQAKGKKAKDAARNETIKAVRAAVAQEGLHPHRNPSDLQGSEGAPGGGGGKLPAPAGGGERREAEPDGLSEKPWENYSQEEWFHRKFAKLPAKVQRSIEAGENGFATLDEIRKQTDREHRRIVQEAIRAGKDVPPEVLKDYSDPRDRKPRETPTPQLPEGWSIKPVGEQFGLFREGRKTPVAKAKSAEELVGKVAQPSAKPRQPAPTSAEDAPKSAGHVAFVGKHEYYRGTDGRLYKATIGSKITKTGNRNGNLTSEKEMEKAQAKAAPSAPASKFWDDVPGDVVKPKNSLNIPRHEMPQISSKEAPKFLQGLKDKGIDVESKEVEVGNLKPIQGELSKAQMAQIPAASLKKSVIASNDGYILDGHHRWGRLLSEDPANKINAHVVDLPMRELLKAASEFPGTTYKSINDIGASKPAPASSGQNGAGGPHTEPPATEQTAAPAADASHRATLERGLKQAIRSGNYPQQAKFRQMLKDLDEKTVAAPPKETRALPVVEPGFTGETVGEDGKTYYFVNGVHVKGPQEVEDARAEEQAGETTPQASEEATAGDEVVAGTAKPDGITRDDDNQPAESQPVTEDSPPAVTSARVALADAIADKFKAGAYITPESLLKLADEAHGGTRGQGKHDPSGVYDSMEAGFNKALLGNTDPTLPLDQAIEQAETLKEDVDALPTQTNRSGKKVTHQQFSTPPHYAYAVAWLANLNKDDLVGEPSAGTGCLAVQAKNSGAQVVTNEIDPDRAEFLKDMFGGENVSLEDGEQLGAIWPNRDINPTAIVMNPPFSQTAGRMGDKKVLMTGANHVWQALQALEDGGRLVAIVGGGFGRRGDKRAGMCPESPTYAEWFRKLAANGFDLRANVGVTGDEYKKYGTHFGTRVLIIDKTNNPKGGIIPTGDVESIPDLMRMLEEIRNDRPEVNRRAPGESAGGELPGEAGAAGTPETAGVGGSPGGDLADDAAGVGAGIDRDPGTVDPVARTEGDAAFASGDNELVGGRPEQPGPRDEASTDGPGVAGAEGAPRPAGAKSKKGGRSGSGGKGGRGKSAKRVALNVPQLVFDQLGDLRPAKPVTLEKPPEAKKATGDNADLGASVYEDFVPAMSIKGMHPHVTPLVESAAMAAVHLPKITYRPVLSPDAVEGTKFTANLPDGSKVDTSLGLSEAGLETVCLMGQAHQQWLPAEEGGVPYRRGCLQGDGTGSGKGRSVAGVLLDNVNQGRTKHVWLSKNFSLMDDARRDMADVGLNPALLFNFKDLKGEKPPKDGICFIPYPTLASGEKDTAEGPGRKNLDVLVDWLGKDFDGCIAFDESHMMANSTGGGGQRVGQPAKMALAGIALQQAVPKARVGYWSATAATEPSNLLYCERLGLWGPGTAFPEKQDFVNELGEGGTATLEAVAQSMKAMGMYNARMVAMDDKTNRMDKDGRFIGRVEAEPLHAPLSEEQRQMYDGAAEGWQHVMRKIDEITEHLGGGPAGKSMFWGAQQRFFNQVLTCMAMPALVKSIDEDLAAGRAPVVQLVNTMKASQDRAMANRDADTELDEIDVGPKEILKHFLEKGFPTHRMEEYTPDPINNPERVAYRPVRTAATAGPKGVQAGNHFYPAGTPIPRDVLDLPGVLGQDIVGGELVEDQHAIEEKMRLLEQTEAMKIPESPLDQMVRKYGSDFAEVTGRNERFIWDEKGEKQVEKRSKEQGQADTQAFQDGRKKILAFSGAGNTGKSYHADARAKNQGRRVHYVLQPGWSATPLVQSLGRCNRANQTSAPIIRPIGIPEVPAQKRFVSSAARRLESMGGLTRGQRQAAGGGGAYGATDNLETPEAVRGLSTFWRAMADGQYADIPFEQTLTKLGYEPYDNEGQPMDPPKITQFLNRLLILPLKEQNRVFDAFSEAHQAVVEQATKEGTLDKGVENWKADQIEHVATEPIYTHAGSGAQAQLISVKSRKKIDKVPWQKVTQEGAEKPLKFVKNQAHNGKVWAVYEGMQKTDVDTGRVYPTYWLKGIQGHSSVDQEQLDHPESNYKELTPAEAKQAWDAEFAKTPEMKESDESFVTGALLPVWTQLQDKTEQQIHRLKMDNGRTIVGRHVYPEKVDELLRGFGVHRESKTHDPREIHARLEAGDIKHIKFQNDWKVRPSKAGAGGEWRLELIGPSIYDRNVIAQGVVKENIAGKPRFFVPTGPDGAAVMEKLAEHHPITQVVAKGDEEGTKLSAGYPDVSAEVYEEAVRSLRKQFPLSDYFADMR